MVRFGTTFRTKKKMSGGISQQFCVRWNSHLGSLGAAFPQLLAGQRFVDVTLACEGHQVHCHRLVLAACSSYFESLLGENPCKHPIIILPRDIKLWEIQALVDFMYKGEVNVSQAGLPDLLKCAEILQIRGLCGSDAALNLNQITTNTPSSTSGGQQHTQQKQQTTSPQQQQHQQQQNQQQQIQNHSIISNNNVTTNNTIPSTPAATNITPTPSSSLLNSGTITSGNNIPPFIANSTSTPISSSTNNIRKDDQSTPIIVHPTVVVPAISLDDGDDDNSVNGSNSEFMDDSELLKIKEDYSDADDSTTVKMEPEKEHLLLAQTTTDQQQHQQTPKHHQQQQHKDINNKTVCGKIRVKSNENLFENYKTQRNHHPSPYNLIKKKKTTATTTLVGDKNSCRKKLKFSKNNLNCIYKNTKTTKTTKETPVATLLSSSASPSSSTVTATKTSTTSLLLSKDKNQNKLLTLSSTPTMNIYKNDKDKNDINTDDNLLPSSLKFNKNSMSIFVRKTSTPNLNIKNDNDNHEQINHNMNDDDQDDEQVIQFNSIDKLLPDQRETNDNFENIICSPNFIELTFKEDDNDDDNDEDDDEDYDNIDNDIDDELISNYIYQNNSDSNTMIDSGVIVSNEDNDDDDDDDDDDDNNDEHCNKTDNIIIDNENFSVEKKLSLINNSLPPLIPFCNNTTTSVTSTNTQEKQKITQNYNTKMKEERRKLKEDKTIFENCLINNGGPPTTFVLRNPRGNQPRTYNTDALWAALMDVKAGESIYRASQMHKVPRKTLRNWMKRWDIKSAYPMPRQLRQAAEKRKALK